MVSLSPTIGKLFGIDLQLHWSFLLLLLVLLLLSPYYFVLWIIIFIFVLMHEMAHSLTARHYGIKVRKILLLPIGGASIIDFNKVKPEQELRISLAGPLSNIVVGLVFVGALALLPGGILSGKGLLYDGLSALAWINLVLGALNFLPGFPIDGGRILRAYLQRKRDYFRATILTVNVSKAVVWIIVIGSMLFVFLAKGYNTTNVEFFLLYDIFIAFFLYEGAQAEAQWAYVRKYAGDVSVESVMDRDYKVVKGNAKISEVYQTTLKNPNAITIYCKARKYYVIKTKQLLKSIGSRGFEAVGKMPLAKFSTEITAVKYGSLMIDAIDEMRNNNSGAVAVVRNKKLVGALTIQRVESFLTARISEKRIAA
jgi:Zn-dependent protease/CBS domain-containing protein